MSSSSNKSIMGEDRWMRPPPPRTSQNNSGDNGRKRSPSIPESARRRKPKPLSVMSKSKFASHSTTRPSTATSTGSNMVMPPPRRRVAAQEKSKQKSWNNGRAQHPGSRNNSRSANSSSHSNGNNRLWHNGSSSSSWCPNDNQQRLHQNRPQRQNNINQSNRNNRNKNSQISNRNLKRPSPSAGLPPPAHNYTTNRPNLKCPPPPSRPPAGGDKEFVGFVGPPGLPPSMYSQNSNKRLCRKGSSTGQAGDNLRASCTFTSTSTTSIGAQSFGPRSCDDDRKAPASSATGRASCSSSSSSNNTKANSASTQEVLDLCDSDDDLVANRSLPSKANPDTTHIIFAIDFSGSMRTKDVVKNNGRITRWDAVFECMEVFLRDQIKQQQQNSNNKEDNKVDGNDVILIDTDGDEDENPRSSSSGTAIVSVIIFNDEAETLLSHMPLIGDGQKVLRALEAARKMHTPKGGTGFAAGFGRAKEIASTEDESGKRLKNTEARNIVLVFLSDGRPGDLATEPPKKVTDPMQTTFRFHNRTFPSARMQIEDMRRLHGDRFSLHLICIYSEGRQWLNYIANRYNGSFHEPDLNVDEDDSSTPRQTMAKAQRAALESDDSSDEEIVEIVVKSQETLIRERHNRALAAGQVFSVANTTTSAGSSMRSTFQSISSSVTAMRGGGNRKLQERQGVMLKETSPMITYRATRMVWNADNEKFVVPSGETPNERKVKVSLHPFAQGGMRNVYRMCNTKKNQQLVAKESRHDVGYKERLRFHIETAKCQMKASKYVAQFKSKICTCDELRAAVPEITKLNMLRSEVIRLKDSRSPGGFRYLAVEKEMKGETYEKWNSNNGFVNPSGSLQCQIAQVFSHFSYEKSKEREMVVDIQGSGHSYTDPQLHSKPKEFGRADRGTAGFKDFFKTHKCNFICRGLELKNRFVKEEGKRKHE